jgi:hypothetical protein
MMLPVDPIIAEDNLSLGFERTNRLGIDLPSTWSDIFSQGTLDTRLRWVFHMGPAEALPRVRQKSLQEYHTHLARFLSFPFHASHCEESEPLVLDNSVFVTGLCDPSRIPLDSMTGIVCEVVYRNQPRLPLALLKVDPLNPNGQMIADYWLWFWNYH